MDHHDNTMEKDSSPASIETPSVFDDAQHQYWSDLVEYSKHSRDEPPLGDF